MLALWMSTAYVRTFSPSVAMAAFLEQESCTSTEEIHSPFNELVHNMSAPEQFSPEISRNRQLIIRESDLAEDLCVISVPDSPIAPASADSVAPKIPTKEPWTCARGFTEEDWNMAYARWKTATEYDSDADESYQEKLCSRTGRPLDENGELSLADALNLDSGMLGETPCRKPI